LKGAAVIRTLESYLGEDAFRAGVRRYMHDYAYGNT
jgi:aminopeptidase N